MRLRVFERAVDEDDARAVRANAAHFDERRRVGHDDRDGNAEPLAVQREGLSVVAG